jgi:hypothetical protein
MKMINKSVGKFLDWFGWNVLGGFPTGIREPNYYLLAYGPYAWGMALFNRSWLKTYK